MNEMYEEVQHILENRRIHSEIRLHDRIEKLHHQYPDLESIEQEIARVTEEELLMALDGNTTVHLPTRSTRSIKREKSSLRSTA